MSNRLVPKQVSANICDYCDEEILDEPGSLQWAQVIRGFLSNPTKTATAFRFRHKKPSDEEIVYDFHANCFDLMVKDMMGRKGVLKPESEG